mmetsp:Transcript_40106/g.74102  ORF Transcript_40106/g.74102 Transcript_40106/m.74102 type:complete len:450 (+) Transcript_40106:271-1620(+)
MSLRPGLLPQVDEQAPGGREVGPDRPLGEGGDVPEVRIEGRDRAGPVQDEEAPERTVGAVPPGSSPRREQGEGDDHGDDERVGRLRVLHRTGSISCRRSQDASRFRQARRFRAQLLRLRHVRDRPLLPLQGLRRRVRVRADHIGRDEEDERPRPRVQDARVAAHVRESLGPEPAPVPQTAVRRPPDRDADGKDRGRRLLHQHVRESVVVLRQGPQRVGARPRPAHRGDGGAQPRPRGRLHAHLEAVLPVPHGPRRRLHGHGRRGHALRGGARGGDEERKPVHPQHGQDVPDVARVLLRRVRPGLEDVRRVSHAGEASLRHLHLLSRRVLQGPRRAGAGAAPQQRRRRRVREGEVAEKGRRGHIAGGGVREEGQHQLHSHGPPVPRRAGVASERKRRRGEALRERDLHGGKVRFPSGQGPVLRESRRAFSRPGRRVLGQGPLVQRAQALS